MRPVEPRPPRDTALRFESVRFTLKSGNSSKDDLKRNARKKSNLSERLDFVGEETFADVRFREGGWYGREV